MRADSVMARGALRLPNTSGPVLLKSNTALPCAPGAEGGGRSRRAATPRMPQEAPPPAPQPDLTQVDLHAESDRGAVVHVVLCRHLQGQAPGLPGGPEGPKHVSHSQLCVCLAGSMVRGSLAAFRVGPGPCPSPAQLPGRRHSHPMLLPPGPPECGPCRPAPRPDHTAR